MSLQRPSRFKTSIRFKLLLASTALLVIPFMGYQYIQEMGNFLRHSQEETLLSNTQIVAGSLASRPSWFTQQSEIPPLPRSPWHLYIRDLNSPIQLDGYMDDWRPYEERMQTFARQQAIYLHDPSATNVDNLKFQVGRHGKYLYAVFHVYDKQVVYRHPNSYRLDRSDNLQVTLLTPAGDLQRYLIATIAPGWVNAHLMPNDDQNNIPIRPELRIKGEWQETSDGYVVEIRLPVSMLGQRIGFAVSDVDDQSSRHIESTISTVGRHQPDELASVIIPSPEIQQTLTGFVHSANRIWVIDKNAKVLGLAGKLEGRQPSQPQPPRNSPDKSGKADNSFFEGLLRLIYQTLLQQPAFEFEDDLSSVSRLDSKEVTSALSGKPAVRWRQTPDKRVSILTASYPVINNGDIIGAVAIETTSNQILLAENRAIEILFNVSLLAFAAAAIILLTFSTRLTGRIRRLRDAAETAIAADGRVHGRITEVSSRDELGDLSRSISDMLDRISQYNRYLESMASKLSHELRTPITVVKSSLENLDTKTLTPDSQSYVQRATEGLNRLNNILVRMSEATRLEQTLQDEQADLFDLCTVIKGSVDGYRLAYPGRTIDLTLPTTCSDSKMTMQGVADLIVQLLDKLVANANDFAEQGTDIEVCLQRQEESAIIRVINYGPLLPVDMQDNLFESMVSVRETKGNEPHLGLGLYIVRLIAEFHHGTVIALNRDDLPGVEFRVALPLRP